VGTGCEPVIRIVKEQLALVSGRLSVPEYGVGLALQDLYSKQGIKNVVTAGGRFLNPLARGVSLSAFARWGQGDHLSATGDGRQ
jgi:hypothetical protein